MKRGLVLIFIGLLLVSLLSVFAFNEAVPPFDGKSKCGNVVDGIGCSFSGTYCTIQGKNYVPCADGFRCVEQDGAASCVQTSYTGNCDFTCLSSSTCDSGIVCAAGYRCVNDENGFGYCGKAEVNKKGECGSPDDGWECSNSLVCANQKTGNEKECAEGFTCMKGFNGRISCINKSIDFKGYCGSFDNWRCSQDGLTCLEYTPFNYTNEIGQKECYPTHYCAREYGARCIEKKFAGQQCNYNYECDSNLCSNNVCIGSARAGACPKFEMKNKPFKGSCGCSSSFACSDSVQVNADERLCDNKLTSPCDAKYVCKKTGYDVSSSYYGSYCVPEDGDLGLKRTQTDVVGFCSGSSDEAENEKEFRCSLNFNSCISPTITFTGNNIQKYYSSEEVVCKSEYYCSTEQQSLNPECARKKDPGVRCTVDYECLSNFCLPQDKGPRTCSGLKEPNVQCSNDFECKSRNCFNGFCSPTKKLDSGMLQAIAGAPCQLDNDCRSGVCSNGVCSAGLTVYGGLCNANFECKSTACEDNKCICIMNDDCSTGFSCNTTIGNCYAKKASGETCVQNNECQNEKCENGKCQAEQAVGGSCVNDFGCLSNLCLNNKCADKGGENAVCASNKECISSKCENNKCTKPSQADLDSYNKKVSQGKGKISNSCSNLKGIICNGDCEGNKWSSDSRELNCCLGTCKTVAQYVPALGTAVRFDKTCMGDGLAQIKVVDVSDPFYVFTIEQLTALGLNGQSYTEQDYSCGGITISPKEAQTVEGYGIMALFISFVVLFGFYLRRKL